MRRFQRSVSRAARALCQSTRPCGSASTRRSTTPATPCGSPGPEQPVAGVGEALLGRGADLQQGRPLGLDPDGGVVRPPGPAEHRGDVAEQLRRRVVVFLPPGVAPVEEIPVPGREAASAFRIRRKAWSCLQVWRGGPMRGPPRSFTPAGQSRPGWVISPCRGRSSPTASSPAISAFRSRLARCLEVGEDVAGVGPAVRVTSGDATAVRVLRDAGGPRRSVDALAGAQVTGSAAWESSFAPATLDLGAEVAAEAASAAARGSLRRAMTASWSGGRALPPGNCLVSKMILRLIYYHRGNRTSIIPL